MGWYCLSYILQQTSQFHGIYTMTLWFNFCITFMLTIKLMSTNCSRNAMEIVPNSLVHHLRPEPSRFLTHEKPCAFHPDSFQFTLFTFNNGHLPHNTRKLDWRETAQWWQNHKIFLDEAECPKGRRRSRIFFIWFFSWQYYVWCLLNNPEVIYRACGEAPLTG